MKYLRFKVIILSMLATAFLAAAPADSQAEALKRVETDHVCMVNNEDMGKSQIPIKVNGKTYYGCCAMCVSTLTNDADARRAVDPISGHIVDKTDAVIGAKADGSVLYFENEATFAAYQNTTNGDAP